MANKLERPDHFLTTPRVGRGNRNVDLAGRSWLYFAQAGDVGPVKIGRSRQVDQRIIALGTASPVPVRLLGTIPETWLSEQDAHAALHRLRLHGEWFKPEPIVLALADAGRRVFAKGYTDICDDDEAFHLFFRARHKLLFSDITA